MSEKTSLEKFIYKGNQATLGQRFENWLELFDLAVSLNGVKEEQQKGYLLLNIGEELLEIYRSKRKDANDDYRTIREMLSAHLKPHRVVFTEVMVFRRAKRFEGESASEFATRLRGLAKYCEFKEIDAEILQQFVAGIDRPEVERKCVTAENLTLAKAIEIATSLENLDANVKGLHAPTEKEMTRRGVGHITEEDCESVNAMRHNQRHSNPPQQRRQDDNNRRPSQSTQASHRPASQPSQQACGNCGRERHERREQCRAHGKQCNTCNKLGHFAQFCRSGTQTNTQPPRGPITGANGPNRHHGSNGHGSSSSKKIGQISTAQPTTSRMIEVSEEEYNNFDRYRKSVEWMGAIKDKFIGRLNDGPRRMFHLLGRDVDCLVDTGAPVNLIDEETFRSLSPKPALAKCNTDYFPYGEGVKTPIPIIGQFTERVWYRGRECQAGFVVVRGKEECLMSYRTAVTLGIVSMDDTQGVGSIKKPDPSQRAKESKMEDISKSFPPPKKNGKYSKEELKEMFPSLFSGTLGCLKDVRVQLHLDPEVKPVRQKLRPLPFHLREAVSKEIKKQIELGILERVTDDMGPTPWVSNIVPVLKDKEVKLGRDGKPSPERPQAETTPDVRITVDNRAQNKAIRRTHYPTKTVEELLYEANGSKVFSKLDIIKAFHQFMLEETQRQLTVITTHEGLLRYTRLHMGISCASEEFSEHIRRVLEGIIGQVNMTDDVLIHGANEHEHQQALLSTLKKLEDAGLTLNLEKCEFYKEEVKFYGLRFTKDGVSPTEERVKALKECATPTDVKSLRSFLCTVLWSARFMKDICTIAEPLEHENLCY
jgi:hypothetical protein